MDTMELKILSEVRGAAILSVVCARMSFFL